MGPLPVRVHDKPTLKYTTQNTTQQHLKMFFSETRTHNTLLTRRSALPTVIHDYIKTENSASELYFVQRQSFWSFWARKTASEDVDEPSPAQVGIMYDSTSQYTCTCICHAYYTCTTVEPLYKDTPEIRTLL